MHSSNLSGEHLEFYERFQSFWAAPSGARVAELIAPDAKIHFTGAGEMSGDMYKKALSGVDKVETRYILDYTVPTIPIAAVEKRPENIQHIRVGLLKTFNNNPFLKGTYDTCMGHDENHIVPCHFGCILNTVQGRETNEVGEIDQKDVERMWKLTTARGFQNVTFDYK